MAGVLRDLSFEYLRVTILSIEHTSRVLVEWKLNETRQNLINLKFFIDRGESPSELEQITPAAGISPTDLLEYVDYTAPLIDLKKQFYYRIRAVEFSNNLEVQTFESPVETFYGDLDLVGLYIVDEHLYMLRHTSAGMPAMIFQKRRSGTKCPDCWDTVLKRVTKSNCTTCFGTGMMEGYYPPIDAWMGFEASPDQAQVADFGVRQHSQTDILFTNYPKLRIGDVIFEVKPHRFWRVMNSRFPEKNRAPTLQTVRVDEIKRADIEYKLEIDDARRKALLDDLEARKEEPEF